MPESCDEECFSQVPAAEVLDAFATAEPPPAFFPDPLFACMASPANESSAADEQQVTAEDCSNESSTSPDESDFSNELQTTDVSEGSCSNESPASLDASEFDSANRGENSRSSGSVELSPTVPVCLDYEHCGDEDEDDNVQGRNEAVSQATMPAAGCSHGEVEEPFSSISSSDDESLRRHSIAQASPLDLSAVARAEIAIELLSPELQMRGAEMFASARDDCPSVIFNSKPASTPLPADETLDETRDSAHGLAADRMFFESPLADGGDTQPLGSPFIEIGEGSTITPDQDAKMTQPLGGDSSEWYNSDQDAEMTQALGGEFNASSECNTPEDPV